MSYYPSLAFLDSAGAGEWVVLFIVILIVVGPKRLPDVVRKLGRTMEMFRRAADEFKDQLMAMDQETHPSPPSALSSGDATGSASAGASSSDAYSDASGYPGNEDHVENWQASEAAPSSDVPPADGAPASGVETPAVAVPPSGAAPEQPAKSPETTP